MRMNGCYVTCNLFPLRPCFKYKQAQILENTKFDLKLNSTHGCALFCCCVCLFISLLPEISRNNSDSHMTRQRISIVLGFSVLYRSSTANWKCDTNYSCCQKTHSANLEKSNFHSPSPSRASRREIRSCGRGRNFLKMTSSLRKLLMTLRRLRSF